MVICRQCGASVADTNVFCPRCGAELSATASESVSNQYSTPVQQFDYAAPAPQTAVPAQRPQKSSPFAVVSTWKFFWSIVLLSLPIVGWVFTILWACGCVKNLNLQRLARAYILIWIVNIVWVLFVYFTGLLTLDTISRFLASL